MRAAPFNLDSSLQTLRHRLSEEAGGPLYRRIVDHLTEGIEAGDLSSGQPLPTIKQLTDQLGVSEMTVRRALNALAEAGLIESRRGSGTVVSGAGGVDRRGGDAALSSPGRLLRIGVVFASMSDGYPFIQPMLQPLEHGHAGAGEPVRMQILHLDPTQSDPNVIRHQLPLDEVDGLMLMSPVNTALLWLCQRRALPYVLLFNDIADGVSSRVICDYHRGMHEAMAHVTAGGCRRPALVTAGDVRFSTGQIHDAFHLAARLHGVEIDPRHVVTADYTQQHGYEATLRLLQQRKRPDVIFYSSDHQACGGLLACQQLSLSVPRDVCVVGAGATVGSMQWPQQLSTIDLALSEMGRLAVADLRRQLEAADVGPRRLVVQSRLIAAATTRTPPQG